MSGPFGMVGPPGILVAGTGIEPVSQAYEASDLPVVHTRDAPKVYQKRGDALLSSGGAGMLDVASAEDYSRILASQLVAHLAGSGARNVAASIPAR